ncbi:polysaccharide biosynthesis/export family protein [Planctomycetota bacterium]
MRKTEAVDHFYQEILRASIVLACCVSFLTGCSPKLSTPEQLQRFSAAGPIATGENVVGLGGTRQSGPYRVIPGDILEFQMPAVLRVISTEFSEWLKPVYGRRDYEPYLARISDAGTITLPIVGQLPVAGMTLAEIEALVVESYFPKYVVNRPMVVCEVMKYQRESERVFTVMGLVRNPNAFPYPPDVQYNLMESLAYAGGLDMTADPRFVKVYRQDNSGEIVSATFSVDSKSFLDAYAVAIKPGDVIYVDHTLRTRVNQFITDVFTVRVGMYADVRD